MRTILSAAALGLLLTAAPVFAGDESTDEATDNKAHGTWFADYDKAVEAAKAQNKNLLVDFTGSDWCGWCIKLHKEVFAHSEFLEPAQKKFVLVALDFPRGEEAKAKVPNPVRNEELKKNHGVSGFPTILLITPEGEVFGRTGYRPGGPEKYIEHLDAATAEWTAASEMMAAWAKADESAKADLMAKACEAMPNFQSPAAAGKIKEIVMAAFASDPENKSGMRLRALETLLKAGMATPELAAAGKKLDPKNEKGLLERIVLGQFQTVKDKPGAEQAVETLMGMKDLTFKDPKIAFRLYFTAARWCAGPLGNPEAAVEMAEKAIATGSDNQPQIDFLKGIIEKNKAQPEDVEEEVEEEAIPEENGKKQPS